ARKFKPSARAVLRRALGGCDGAVVHARPPRDYNEGNDTRQKVWGARAFFSQPFGLPRHSRSFGDFRANAKRRGRSGGRIQRARSGGIGPRGESGRLPARDDGRRLRAAERLARYTRSDWLGTRSDVRRPDGARRSLEEAVLSSSGPGTRACQPMATRQADLSRGRSRDRSILSLGGAQWRRSRGPCAAQGAIRYDPRVSAAGFAGARGVLRSPRRPMRAEMVLVRRRFHGAARVDRAFTGHRRLALRRVREEGVRGDDRFPLRL